MSKSLTCRELGGICDKKLSGNTLMEIVQQGMQHMGMDDAHKAFVANMENRTGENRHQWFTRMQKVFDSKPEDE